MIKFISKQILTGVVSAILVFTSPGVVVAQNFVDSSAENVPPEMWAKVEHGILSELRDPLSALFQNVFILQSRYVCGEVNAKNGFGGYVGFYPFLYKIDDESLTVSDPTYFDGSAFGQLRLWSMDHSGCLFRLGIKMPKGS